MPRPGDCLVSVVVPAFNAAAFLPRAIESALAQTEARLEVLVVDDGSTDDTASVARSYVRRDGRVRLLPMPENRGPSAARNAGFDVARGRWLALLDADDAFRPQRLQRLLQLGEANGADIVSDNMAVHEAGKPVRLLMGQSGPPEGRRMTAEAFLRGNMGDPGRPRFTYGVLQPVFRCDFLQRHHLRHNERNRFGEDFMFSLSCLRAGAFWWQAPDAYYDYIVRPGSLSDRQTAADLHRIYRFECDYLSDPAVAADPALRQALLRHRAKVERLYAYRAVTDALKRRRFSDAARVLFGTAWRPALIAQEAVRQAPVIWRKAVRGGYRSNAPHPP